MPSALFDVVTRHLGQSDYHETWQAMRRFTAERTEESADELWLLHHPAVYTLGQAGRREHLLDPGTTPVVESDRGGQVSWHGPGQLVAYPLLDLRRWGLGVRNLVSALEQAVISLLAVYGIASHRRATAPGVYVDGAKIAALGLRVRRGCCYHGLALNVCNDLDPFARINPCGQPGLRTTRFYDHGPALHLDRLELELTVHLLEALDCAASANRSPAAAIC